MEHPDGDPIEARGLVKRFGELVAVDGVELRVRPGTCLGLLGPNGAGKTTTIEILEGLSRPDAGEVRIFGLDWRSAGTAIRERIGVQLQETRLQDKLTAFETLRLFRSFYDRGREPDDVLTLVGLVEKRDARVVDLSGGQRQRLALGCSLVNDPELLFLDEPTTGLDPQARRRVWQIVEDFKRRGGTVLLTTHYMEEAERLADDLSIMDGGRMIAEGTPPAIIRSLGAESIVEFTLADGEGARLDSVQDGGLEGIGGVKERRRLNDVVTLTVTDTRGALTGLLAWLERHELKTVDLRTHRPTLEDVFVSLTGKQLRDE